MPDELGDGYEKLTIALGADPDGEGEVAATLIRYRPRGGEVTRGAVLYVHGFTDYFFQTHVAEHFARRGYAFFALDLRKCGRSLRPGQTPHFVSDLAEYDEELGRAVTLVRTELAAASGTPADVLLVAHSTGGLILPLWLDRLNRQPGGTERTGIKGLVLNSPWFDLQGPAYLRSVGTALVDVLGRVRPRLVLPTGVSNAYGSSLHRSAHGEWDYHLDWKPLTGFPVTAGWLRAVRAGHARLHRGLNVGIPALVLRSDLSHFTSHYSDRVDVADAVLDVKQIARWSGCLGDRTTVVPVPGARHDVFLSTEPVRERAFTELDHWLDGVYEAPPQTGASAQSGRAGA